MILAVGVLLYGAGVADTVADELSGQKPQAQIKQLKPPEPVAPDWQPTWKATPPEKGSPAFVTEPAPDVRASEIAYSRSPMAAGDTCADPITLSFGSADLPWMDSNYTCGRVNDYEDTCLGYYDGGEDIIYAITPTEDITVDIKMDPLGTTWTGLAIDDSCPLDPATCIATSTGSSGIREIAAVPLTNGVTYYIQVDTWPSPDCIPDFDLTITEFGACPLDCPPGGIAEAEPCGDDTNGGCGGDPPTEEFEAMACGDTKCGTVWADVTRDTDWYEVEISAPSIINVELTAQIPTVAFILDVPNCVDIAFLNDGAYPWSDDCIPGSGGSVPLDLGTYYIFVATGNADGSGVFDGYPCGGPAGNDYVMTVTCDPVPLGACCDLYGNCTPDQSEVACTTAGGIWQGDGTVCDPNPCVAYIGACCFQDGSCVPDLSEPDCIAAGGIYQGDGTVCVPNPCVPFYCDVCYSDLDDDWITNVTFNTINNDTVAEGAPCSYGDYTGMSTTVARGSTHTLSVTFQSGTYTEYVKAWFDWNQDYVFDVVTEEYFIGSGASTTVSLPITIPIGAALGATRMRVVEDYGSAAFGPCEDTYYGEAEDYTVVIEEAPPIGACCDGPVCIPDMTEADCIALPGVYQGDGSTCTPINPCVGACCHWPSGACTEDTEADCIASGDGTFYGYGTTCATTVCPTPGDNCAEPFVVSLGLGDLPWTNSNYNCGRGNDYADTCLGSYDGGEDMIYAFTPTEDMTVSIEMDPLGLTWTGIAIDDSCPLDASCLGVNTGSSGVRLIECVALTGGVTYYIQVDTWPSPTCLPAFDLTISWCEPCVVECPPGGIPEGEPDCYDEYDDAYNGGCNSTPVAPSDCCYANGTPGCDDATCEAIVCGIDSWCCDVEWDDICAGMALTECGTLCSDLDYPFSDINLGDKVCGTAGTFLFGGSNYRDTDWYRVTTDDWYELTWTLDDGDGDGAEFDSLIFVIDSGSGDCVDYVMLGDATAGDCEIATLTTECLRPGTYWVLAMPAVFTGVPCGSDYVATLTGAICDAQHCAASGGCDEYIENVAVGTIDNTTGCDNYGDYKYLSTTMPQGSSFPITITIGNGYTSDYVGLWIDWNADWIFDEVHEAVTLTGGNPGPGPYSGMVTPPLGATLGDVVMRIRLTWNGVPVPCGTTTYGEVEDYTITVTPPIGACCDGASCTITTQAACPGMWAGPATECGGDCQPNGIADTCDILYGTSLDCQPNGIPDECEDDCNSNGIPDDCDMRDCTGEGWCDDCDGNGIMDECDMINCPSEPWCDDCQPDGILDACQLYVTPSRSVLYQWDDGTTENGIGLTSGGEMCWMQSYTAQTGGEGIIAVMTAYGTPAYPGGSGLYGGEDVRAYVWDDPDNDGDPTNAVLLAEVSDVVAAGSIDTDVAQSIAFDPPVVVSGVFWVGVSIVHGAGEYPGPVDDTTYLGVAWAAFNTVPFDPNDLTGAVELGAIGLPGTWLLRAEGVTPGPPPNDCNQNGVPDECDPDADGDGIPDDCDECTDTDGDGYGNPGYPENTCPDDNCPDDFNPGQEDCDNDGIGDPCDMPDCNDNDIPDNCDIDPTDPDGNGLVSPDCNENDVPDECDIADGTSQDCNDNDIPDECDIADGTSEDCQPDGIPDECQLVGNDCQPNGIPDDCEVDCNGNNIPDDCDIRDCDGSWWCLDCQPDGIPDGCQLVDNDRNQNLIPDDCEWGACCYRTAGVCFDELLPEECFEEWYHLLYCGVGIECEKVIVPTLSEWGVMVMSLLMVSGIATKFGRRRK